jgi:hypothetical protein
MMDQPSLGDVLRLINLRESPMRHLGCFICLMASLAAAPVLAQSGGGGGGAGGAGSGGAGSAGTGGSSASSSAASTGSSAGQTGPTSQPRHVGQSANGQPGISLSTPPTTPSSGGAVGGPNGGQSGAGQTAPNGQASGTPAAINQREQAAGVAAAPSTTQSQSTTLDQLDQKLESTSGASPRCPPSVMDCSSTGLDPRR